jgi:uncharacterized membrane protein
MKLKKLIVAMVVVDIVVVLLFSQFISVGWSTLSKYSDFFTIILGAATALSLYALFNYFYDRRKSKTKDKIKDN